MAILAFDIGGSAVKFGLWKEGKLSEKDSFPISENWEKLKANMFRVYQSFSAYLIEGVALSAPGLVNEKTGQIEGVSAVPYIHRFNIIEQLEELFNKKVTMENDANCAALAEVWQGSAKNDLNSIFVVIGSGIGGSIIIDRKLFKGNNLFGGEFGYMMVNDTTTWSESGSWVKTVSQYNEIAQSSFSGQELLKLVQSGDLLAKRLFENFNRIAAIGIYNLLVSFDPGVIVLGGGISASDYWILELRNQIKKIMLERGVIDMVYRIEPCTFRNEANLIGAVFHFISKGE